MEILHHINYSMHINIFYFARCLYGSLSEILVYSPVNRYIILLYILNMLIFQFSTNVQSSLSVYFSNMKFDCAYLSYLFVCGDREYGCAEGELQP